MPVHLLKLKESVEYWDYFNKSDRSQMGPHRRTQLQFSHKQNLRSWLCQCQSILPYTAKRIITKTNPYYQGELTEKHKNNFSSLLLTLTKKKKDFEHQDDLKLLSLTENLWQRNREANNQTLSGTLNSYKDCNYQYCDYFITTLILNNLLQKEYSFKKWHL